MLRRSFLGGCAAALLAGCATTPPAPPAPPPAGPAPAAAPTPAAAKLQVPVEYYRLKNGLRVVLSHEPSVPTATIAMYYHIGFRIEPQDRTGFAHLFEHLMFQETTNLAKGEADRIVSGNGGVSNGSTRFDYTNYFQVVPSHVVEPVLWIEADRMRGLVLSEASMRNQKDVVKNEVRVNVLNRPYGGFPWLDLPQHANTNWYNAHNFYGELKDIEAAHIDDVRKFYDTYYVPSNAVLVVAGAFDPPQVRAWIEKYFGGIAARPEPAKPDVTEPRQEQEKRVQRKDPLAPRPAVAYGWHVPPRNTPEWYAFGVLDQVLLQGEDSRLWQRIVQEKGYSDSIDGGINLLGNMFNYEGPMLWSPYLIHDAAVPEATITAEIDDVITRLQREPVGRDELERALTKVRSSLYDVAGSPTRFGLVDLLASFALFDDDPARINRIDDELRKVTPELVMQTAREYLRPTNRTVLTVLPGRAAPTTPAATTGGR
jgi:predicted Zn-dependent peptidase